MNISKTQVTLGLSIVAVLAVYFVGRKALQGAAVVGNAVNPLNRENVFAAGINAAGGAIATAPDAAGKNADGSWSLGGWWFDITNPETAEAVRNVTQPVQAKSVTDGAAWTPQPIDYTTSSAWGA